ncbi:TetR/AcrR family transcriptional regulator [Jatrophihabitans endophyticus]|uniref:TetR/AcrR family transcriptional regulator n=1 Tax=Jatrophihabitans endophyticus TaxID=1206085 RepID=UPI0009347850|nr:TetR family transcriptional regulator C-terminal domain-containing protein [Jatrophihabitans endophyticus]
MGAPRSTPRGPGYADPDRPQRIVDAALQVVGRVGVGRTTHRAISAQSGIPLGSLTYHYDSLDDLLKTAFSQVADRIAARFQRTMARYAEDPREGVVAIIDEFVDEQHEDLVLSLELYVLAARDQRYREIMERWQHAAAAVFAAHFDAVTARMVDALLEGLIIHGALSTEPHDREFVRTAVYRITS